jgi:hypothetical protein
MVDVYGIELLQRMENAGWQQIGISWEIQQVWFR